MIGAGFIGLEFAATARAKGLEVDVIELAHARDGARGDRGNLGIFSGAAHRGRHPHSSRRAGDQHRERRQLTSPVSASATAAISPADLVVVGVGVLPNVELAAEAGLPVASGIIVDEQLLTSDPEHLGDRRLRAVRKPALRRLAAAGVGAERHRPGALRRGAADRRRQDL